MTISLRAVLTVEGARSDVPTSGGCLLRYRLLF